METFRQLGLPVDAIYLTIKMSGQSVVVLMGVFGNMYTIYSVLTKSKLHKITNTFMIALSVGLILQALNATIDYINHFNDKEEYYWSRDICDLWHTMNVYLPSMLALLCFFAILDRYMILTRPKKHKTFMNLLVVSGMIGVSYVVPALVSIPPILMNLHTTPEYMTNRPEGECKFKITLEYALISPIVTFWIPLVMDAVIIIKLFKAMEKHDRWLTTIAITKGLPQTKDNEVAMEKANKSLPYPEDQMRRQHRLAITLWSVYWNVSLFWIPHHVWQAIYKITDADWPRATNFMPWFGYLPSAILPGLLIYYSIWDI